MSNNFKNHNFHKNWSEFQILISKLDTGEFSVSGKNTLQNINDDIKQIDNYIRNTDDNSKINSLNLVETHIDKAIYNLKKEGNKQNNLYMVSSSVDSILKLVASFSQSKQKSNETNEKNILTKTDNDKYNEIKEELIDKDYNLDLEQEDSSLSESESEKLFENLFNLSKVDKIALLLQFADKFEYINSENTSEKFTFSKEDEVYKYIFKTGSKETYLTVDEVEELDIGYNELLTIDLYERLMEQITSIKHSFTFDGVKVDIPDGLTQDERNLYITNYAKEREEKDSNKFIIGLFKTIFFLIVAYFVFIKD